VFAFASVSAVQAFAQATAVDPPAQQEGRSAPARAFLTKDDVKQKYVGRSQTIKWASGVQTKWDVRDSGDIFYNNLSLGNVGGNGSGSWELKDNGAFCWKWNRVESGNPGCLFYFTENGKTLVVRNRRPDSAAVGEVLE
jgi:hypothetical protein